MQLCSRRGGGRNSETRPAGGLVVPGGVSWFSRCRRVGRESYLGYVYRPARAGVPGADEFPGPGDVEAPHGCNERESLSQSARLSHPRTTPVEAVRRSRNLRSRSRTFEGGGLKKGAYPAPAFSGKDSQKSSAKSFRSRHDAREARSISRAAEFHTRGNRAGAWRGIALLPGCAGAPKRSSGRGEREAVPNSGAF